jgi:hypothetical protein
MQSACTQRALSMQSACNQEAMPSVRALARIRRNQHAINLQSVCLRHAISTQSACTQHALSVHSACNQHAIVDHPHRPSTSVDDLLTKHFRVSSWPLDETRQSIVIASSERPRPSSHPSTLLERRHEHPSTLLERRHEHPSTLLERRHEHPSTLLSRAHRLHSAASSAS